MKQSDVKEIIIHCSATRECDDSINAEVIDRWHKDRVLMDGTIETGRMVDQCGAHTKGHNCESIGVCYIGGVESDGKTPKDTRTPEQIGSLLELLLVLRKMYPGAKIYSHGDFAAKACPSFDATAEYIYI